MGNSISSATESGRNRNYLASSAPTRVTFIVVIGAVAWMFAITVFLVVRSARPQYPFSLLVYPFPILHLLPWAAGLTYLRKIRGLGAQGTLEPTAVEISSGFIVALLTATYVVLCLAESIAILAFRMHGLGILGRS